MYFPVYPNAPVTTCGRIMNNLFPGENQLASATAISDALTLEAVRNESPDQGYGHRR